MSQTIKQFPVHLTDVYTDKRKKCAHNISKKSCIFVVKILQ